jgi:hypothetical protein
VDTIAVLHDFGKGEWFLEVRVVLLPEVWLVSNEGVACQLHASLVTVTYLVEDPSKTRDFRAEALKHLNESEKACWNKFRDP